MTDTAGNFIQEQGSDEFQSLGSILASTIEVIGCSDVKGAADGPGPSKARGPERQPRASRRREKKKGGWPVRRGHELSEVRLVLDIWHAAHHARRPFNYKLTVNLPEIEGESPGQRKKRHGRVPERIQAGLSRRGQPFIAVMTYEALLGERTHLNILMHARPQDVTYLKGWHRLPDIHVCRASVDDRDARYITKQRKTGSPEWEWAGARMKGARHIRKAGLPIKGKNLIITPAAEALLALDAKPVSKQIVPEPQRQSIVYTVDATGQFQLFDEPPVLVSLDSFRGGKLPPLVAEQLEARRRQLGLTQRELGLRAGLSQPTLANAIAGRFGVSRHAIGRLQTVLKAAA